MDCNIRCWECKQQDCSIRDAMIYLPENEFYRQTILNAKANVGMNQLLYGWSNEKAKDFMMKYSVAFYIARKQLLKTLKK